ncbi:MAG: 16S rRNA (guanine(527)-N(7))-methyltransferase RsmG [Phycisphaerales bacterium]|jgi:16S rRNA (guanine527-N7)-methyltransferase|nr:16S rRNA (guanine(527)-N(7))-methyltransferase RsmG [Phycisphaerales bacterium]
MDDLGALQAMAVPYELELTAEEWSTLSTFLDLLTEANSRMNLTRIVEREDAWRRHVLDSLTLLPFIEAAGARHLLDLGSGGGFPGIPLAICRPDLPVTLLEATGKKARYLAETATSLGLDHVTVLSERAETLGSPDGGGRGAWDVVTARAVGGLPVLLELALPLVSDGGALLAIKGERAEQEIAEAGQALRTLKATIEITRRTPTGTIVVARRTGPIARQWPRRPGEPARAPIGGVPRDQR